MKAKEARILVCGLTLTVLRSDRKVRRHYSQSPQFPISRARMCYIWHMTSVGVRELRQRASELLRLVEQGETVEITDRGRPVALLSPLPQGTPLEQLRAGGETAAATIGLEDLSEPLVLADGIELPSAALDRLRNDER